MYDATRHQRAPISFLLALLLALAASVVGLAAVPAAQADIAVGSSTSATAAPPTSGGSLTIAKPAGTDPGEVMLAQVTFNNPSGLTVTPPLTGGWTQIVRTDRGNQVGQATFWKVAGASEPESYTWTFSGPRTSVGGITTYTGVDTTSPIQVFDAQGGTSESPTAPSVTASAGSQVVALYGLSVPATTTPPGSLTTRYTTSGAVVRATAAGKAVAVSGATGDFIGTHNFGSNQQWVAQTVSLRQSTNSAPTNVSISGASSADEAGSGAYTAAAATDPDGDTLTYAWTVVSGPASITGAANQVAASLAFGDGPGTVVLRVTVSDGHGHNVPSDLSIDVGNLAPTATFTAPATVAEGSPIGLALTGADDPSAADDAAGFSYAFDCGGGFGDFGPTATASCPTNDQGSRTVRGQVKDRDGGVATYSATVSITNAAPTATFAHDGPVDEGSPFTLSLEAASDPSSTDTDAGFSYAFDCGDGYAAASATASRSCPTTDNGSRTVRGKVIDKDGGATEYSSTVGVDNVDPTATFTATSPVNEGDDIGLALTDPGDPSSDDTAAGFGYAFDCDTADVDGPVDNGSVATEDCGTDDDGTRGVAGRLSDKDGGATTYDANVTIANVAPTGTFTPVSSVDEGSSFSLSLDDVADASPVDAASLEFAFDCGDGAGFGAYGANAATCPTDDDGVRTVRAKVRDKDDGESTYSATLTVKGVAPTASLEVHPTGDVDEGSDFTLSLVDALDPSSVDQAGLVFRFDCGDGAGLQPAGTQNSATCPTDDNGVRHVAARVVDPDGLGTTYDVDVTVANVSPVPTLDAPASVNEGSDIHLSASDVVDVSSVDEAAGFTFSFDCGSGSGFGDYGPADAVDCPTTDDDVRVVGVRARDKDGGVGHATGLVEVLNVAPQADFAAGDVDEGDPVELSLTDVTDPSPADTFSYAFHCGDTVFGAFADGDFGAASTASCPTDDDGVVTVTGAVRDDDGGTTVYSVEVTVANVAPTGTFTTGDVDEGSPIGLAITDVTDPSSADTAAGFEYSFDCGSGYGAWSAASTATCPTTDQGGRTVGGKVRDKDEGESGSVATVTVNSVAPTGTFTAPSSVSEGDDIGLAISGVTDPSPDDTAAGFSYAFDCGDGAGYGALSGTASRTCPTDDGGSRDVRGQVQDKDAHATDYGATVTVDNVAPSGTFAAPGVVDEGSGFSLALTGVTDPSSADTEAGFEYAFDCGAGYAAYSSSSSRSCETVDNEVRTVRGKVRDKDGGEREYTATTTVLNVAPTVVASAGQPTLPGISTSVSLGSFSDPGVDDALWTVDVSWGDGSTDTYTVTGQGTLPTWTHTWALASSYTVTVRVTDKDGDWSSASFGVQVHLTDKVLLGNEDVEIAGSRSQVQGNVHANRDVKITGAGGDVCGDLTAGRAVEKMGTQSCGTTTAPAALATVPVMANYLPTTVTHTLTGDRVLNGYTCTLVTGCVVKVTGRLELRGVVTGKVWFLVDKDVVIKGDLAPAAGGKLRVHSKLTIDVAAAKASVTGQFLAATGLKLSGSSQILTGLFWGQQYVDMSGSNGSLRGAVVSNGSIKLAGSSRTVTYDAEAIKLT